MLLQWKQLVLVELVANRIACGFVMAERQQDHFGSPMAAGARGVAKGERERVREERGRKRKEGGRRKKPGGTCHNDNRASDME